MGGALVISLDFELHWGVPDLVTAREYRARAPRLREAVPCLLKTFRARAIHATWATVGFLFHGTREELTAGLPRVRPGYADRRLDPYGLLDELGESEADDPSHYAASLVRDIAATPHQEVGTHTYSHYYGMEEGQTAEAFRADLEAAAAAARRLGITLRSLVFPRNQVNPAYLPICAQAGIVAYRGAGSHWLYRPRRYSEESQQRRAIRLADAYINLSGHHGHPMNPAAQWPVDVPASRLLRTHLRPLGALEPLRLRRFEKDLEDAAVRGRMYHLWLHPEEFGSSLERNRAFLECVLDRYIRLRERYGMESMSMAEAADRLASGRDKPVNTVQAVI